MCRRAMKAEHNAATANMESDVYERNHGHHSDFDGANGECAQCGVPTYHAPDIHDVHPIQMQYEPDGEVLCEACFFDGYDRTGLHIAQTEMVTMYRVRVDYKTLFFENWQAASGFARREEEAEYLGEAEIARAKLERID